MKLFQWKKYKKHVDDIFKNKEGELENRLSDIAKVLEELKSHQKSEAKTAMQQFIEWLKNDYDDKDSNTVLMKAFDLIEEEKRQVLEAFSMGFAFSGYQFHGDSEVEDLVQRVDKIALEYYEDTYSDSNLETD